MADDVFISVVPNRHYGYTKENASLKELSAPNYGNNKTFMSCNMYFKEMLQKSEEGHLARCQDSRK